MNIRRIGVLLSKEFFYGSRNYIIIFSIAAPIMISIIISLIFGTWLTDTPRLGILDEGSSGLVSGLESLNSIDMVEYSTASGMKQAVEDGAVDIGIVIPPGFDNSITRKEGMKIETFIWGESLLKSRIIIGISIANALRELAGQETPVELTSVTLGDGASIPWNERLFPLVVLMTIFLGGLMLPSTSIAIEKEKGTIRALMLTPASVREIFLAKGILGFILSFFMGILILTINRAFGSKPLLLIMVLALGVVMAAELGVLLGVYVKDFTTIFTIWKSAGIILFAPAIIYMFPGIPQWIGKIFPTYYVTQPIVELSQGSGGWPDISLNTLILIAIDVALILIIFLALKKRQYAVTGE